MNRKQVAFLAAAGIMSAVFAFAQTGGTICIQENSVNKGCVQYLNFQGDTAAWVNRNVAFLGISDAGVAFARYAADAGHANNADTATTAGTATYALDAGQANYAPQAGNANTANTANYAADAGYANTAGTAGSAGTCAVAAYALDAGAANYATSAGSAGTATTAAYAADAGNVVCTGCIIADRIAGLAIDSSKLAAFAVTRAKIGLGEIDNTVIADGGIVGGNITPGGIGTPQLASLAVTNGIIGPLAITEDKIDAGAITSVKILDGAVQEGKIATGAVTVNKIGLGAVTEAKLDTGAVTETKIGTGAVTVNKIGTDAVTDVKILNGAVTENKIGTGAVTVNKIGLGAVTDVKLATDAVTTVKIANGNVTNAKVAAQAIDWTKLDDGAPIMAWDEGRGSLLSGRVTLTNGGTMTAPEANQGYTSWGVTSGTTDFYVETDVQFRTIKDQYVSITYRTGGTTGWAASSTMKVVNMGNTAQTATATMYGDGLWHTAIFDISAWTGTSTVRFDAQDGGAAIGAGATFWVANLVVGSVGVGPGGGHTLSSYRGNVGINVAKPTYQLETGGSTAQFPTLFAINATAHATSRRAAMYLGDWLVGQDSSGNGTKDFFLYNANLTVPQVLSVGTTGQVNINQPSSGYVLRMNGTSSPTAAVINSSNAAATYPNFQVVNFGANGGFPVYALYSSRGTEASPSSSSNGDVLGANIYYGRVLSSFAEGARQEAVLTAAPGLTTLTTALRWYTSNASSSTEKMRLTPAGTLAIGATATSGNTYLLVNSGDIQMGQNTGVLSNTYYDTAWRYAANGFASAITQTSGAVQFQTAPNNISGAGATATMTERMRVANGGNVSIGVAADGEEKLEVRTGTNAYGLLHSNGTIKVGTYISGEGQIGTKSNHDFGIFTNNAGASLRVTAAGEVRIPAYAGGGTTGASLDNNGRIIRTVSDERLKENISDLPRGLDSVLRMRPVRFQWRDKQSYGDRWDIGFIAQEMISCVPEAVSQTPEGMYSLDYGKLLAVVVGAIQELFDDRTWLARRVQELEDKAAKAEQRLADLEARLARLEAGGNMQ